ncbi:cysteine-rich receptor-like protein kinase 10 isoform X1 [Chenopodium quinoa]|uniref:Cysteine-rich receptor-like protein kinase 10 n=1 Tax=Chenopodium quinoa TaxID=63459 RepID=A0A803NDA4_CHEQI|nr:cysteine-rich receptor-like protein kinase 10 isoform X1 [Chenopodium quinoa]XP_021735526.1 cysteine-rich receptor-like protein kinase 10 isoform X1 [Chenopodium quinoa]XP_021735527.1 cysteine-rich receptor-like protein kinase 10 isoform X1 [Chenopodium quinoa]XP_021735528.1 cysteine-rich receptor-like protein kinase 10 isoform X1 [Chenopodium quinoa]XP_021766958.1 cysteine-rich receptor-like protein kinase 10 isoform X1 [Chenopodium quinoa]XP_021766959.1 cysteine-rich receptor-like protein
MGRFMFTFTLLILICFGLLYGGDAEVTYVNITGCAPAKGNYTDGSFYQQNLNRLFTDLSSHTSSQKFYDSTVGSIPNKVYGLYQCREDVSFNICSECIQAATQKIVEVCPLMVEATVWYYECMLRYANRSIFSSYETYPAAYLWSFKFNVSNYGAFAPVLAREFNSLIRQAVIGTSSGRFATGDAKWATFERVYCLVQCTPDIDDFGCNSCLTSALSDMAGCCNASARVFIFKPSCHLRYDTTEKFYFDINHELPAPPPSNVTTGETSNEPPEATTGLKRPIIVAIAVGASVGFLLLLVGLWLCMRPSMRRKESTPTLTQAPPPQQLDNVRGEEGDSLGDTEFVQYDFATLKDATSNFSSDNKLGEGGFGAVYMGTLNSGQVLAIKRLSGNSGQGAKEFMTEARLVAKLQHRNLVKLLGFCSQGDEKLLVYEFLPNSSVDRFLFDPRKRGTLDWETRYKIIMGVARGLQYLHEDSRLTIIHRDLKPNNILLDKDMNPKIGDFGMAKLFGREQKFGNTSQIVGTHGYMAPEYMLTGEYSDKSDVYSFGIIILELISGLKNRLHYQSSHMEDIPVLAWRLWNAGRSLELLDSTLLHDNYTRNEVLKCIQIGLLCVQGSAVRRPTMAAVVLMLNGSVTLPLPSTPIISPHQFNDGQQTDSTAADQSMSKSVTWDAEVERDLYPR